MGTIHYIGALRPARSRDTARGQRLAEAGLVAALVALATALRWPGLSAGLRLAESATYAHAVTPTWQGVLERVSVGEVDPPGFFVLMHGWTQAFGVSELALKLPVFILGVWLIPATYILTRHITGSPRASLLAAGVSAVAPEAVFSSTDARPPAVAALLACLTVLFYIRSATEARPQRALVALIVCGAAGVTVHQANVALVAALGLVTAVLWSRRLLPGRSGLVWALLLIGIGAGLQTADRLDWWAGGTAAATAGTTIDWRWSEPRDLSLLLPLPPADARYAPFRRAAVLLMAACLAMTVWRTSQAWRARKRVRPLPRRYTFAIAGATFLVTTSTLSVLPATRQQLFPIAPLGWIVGTWLLVTTIDDVRKRWRGAWGAAAVQSVAPLLLVVFLAPNAHSVFALHAAPRSGVRALVTNARAQDDGQTMYLMASEPVARSVRYYLSREPAATRDGGRAPAPGLTTIGTDSSWRRSASVDDVVLRMRDAQREGYRRVALVHIDGRGGGDGPASGERAVVEWLHRQLQPVDTRLYSGALESARVSVFALDPSSDTQAAHRAIHPARATGATAAAPLRRE